jgi:hypothetical protein
MGIGNICLESGRPDLHRAGGSCNFDHSLAVKTGIQTFLIYLIPEYIDNKLKNRR